MMQSQTKKTGGIESYFKKSVTAKGSFNKSQKLPQNQNPNERTKLDSKEIKFESSHKSPLSSATSSPKAEMKPIQDISKTIIPSPLRVPTPDWNRSRELSRPTSVVPKISELNLQELHYSLEVVEHRIQQGDDLAHEHPAQCVSAYLRTGVGPLSPEEKLLQKGYDNWKPEIIVPSFWPPRVWDSVSIRLSEEETQKLVLAGTKHVNKARKHRYYKPKEEEDFQPDSDEDAMGDVAPIAPIATPTRSRRTMTTRASGRKVTHDTTTIFCYSTKYYETDVSEDETDPEDFF